MLGSRSRPEEHQVLLTLLRNLLEVRRSIRRNRSKDLVHKENLMLLRDGFGGLEHPEKPPCFSNLQKIIWEELAAKRVPAPFKPVIRDELDVSNFADEFTEMDPTYSPAALPQNCDRIFQVGGGLGEPRV